MPHSLRTLILASAWGTAPCLASGVAFEWSDPASGREYALLNGKRNWDRAAAACLARGMVLFDLRYVSDAEREAFLAGPVVPALPWNEHFTGTSRAFAVSEVWQSAQGATVADNGVGFGSALLLLNRKKGVLYSALEWRSASDQNAHAICMSVESFWYRCAVQLRCIEVHGNLRIPISSYFVEFGNSEIEARRRVLEAATDPKHAVSESRCSIATETMHCLRELPKP